MKFHYTILFVWSEKNRCYLVHLPEFPTQKFHTHGETYEEALKNAQEVLELLVEEYQPTHKPVLIPINFEQRLQLI